MNYKGNVNVRIDGLAASAASVSWINRFERFSRIPSESLPPTSPSEHCFYSVLKHLPTYTVYRIAESLAGFCVLFKKGQCCLHNIVQLVLFEYDRQDSLFLLGGFTAIALR